MVDAQGYRKNVGIVIVKNRKILLAKRRGQNAWQLPQGGVDANETMTDALFRELNEEVGLLPEHIEVVAKTSKWLRYRLPKKFIHHHKKPLCVGQKQIWFLLKLKAGENHINLNGQKSPEFDNWKWSDYWRPIEAVIDFKKNIYEDMLKAFAPVVFENQNPHIPECYRRPPKCFAVRFNVYAASA